MLALLTDRRRLNGFRSPGVRLWKLQAMRKENGPVQFAALVAAGVFVAVSLAAGAVARFGQSAASDYSTPVMVGRIEAPDVTESSGLSASECQDVLWTHNDAGNEPLIFAMDLTGKHLGAWKVEGTKNSDWESIATHRDSGGACFLMIGDLGDNEKVRKTLEIYRIPEPKVSANTASSTAADPMTTGMAEVMKYSYSDGSHNAETLLVHPKTGDIYIVTKEKSGPASVYKIGQQFGSPEILRAERVARISVPSRPEGLLTGGSFSPDGTRLMLCDKKGGYEYVLPADSVDVDEIWKQKPVAVGLGDRIQGEGVSYGRDGMTLFASSEKRNAPLYMIRRKRT